MKFEIEKKKLKFVNLCLYALVYRIPPAQTKLRWIKRTNKVFSLSNMSSNEILSSLGRTTLSIDYEFKEFLIRSSSLEGAVKIVLACQGMHTIQLILTIGNI